MTVKLRKPDLLHSGDEVARFGVELLGRFNFPPDARFRLVGVGVSSFLEKDEEPAAEAEPSLFAG